MASKTDVEANQDAITEGAFSRAQIDAEASPSPILGALSELTDADFVASPIPPEPDPMDFDPPTSLYEFAQRGGTLTGASPSVGDSSEPPLWATVQSGIADRGRVSLELVPGVLLWFDGLPDALEVGWAIDAAVRASTGTPDATTSADPSTCTPSMYPSGSMERMARRGELGDAKPGREGRVVPPDYEVDGTLDGPYGAFASMNSGTEPYGEYSTWDDAADACIEHRARVLASTGTPDATTSADPSEPAPGYWVKKSASMPGWLWGVDGGGWPSGRGDRHSEVVAATHAHRRLVITTARHEEVFRVRKELANHNAREDFEGTIMGNLMEELKFGFPRPPDCDGTPHVPEFSAAVEAEVNRLRAELSLAHEAAVEAIVESRTPERVIEPQACGDVDGNPEHFEGCTRCQALTDDALARFSPAVEAGLRADVARVEEAWRLEKNRADRLDAPRAPRVGEREGDDEWTDEEHWRAMSQEGRSEILYQNAKHARADAPPGEPATSDVEADRCSLQSASIVVADAAPGLYDNKRLAAALMDLRRRMSAWANSGATPPAEPDQPPVPSDQWAAELETRGRAQEHSRIAGLLGVDAGEVEAEITALMADRRTLEAAAPSEPVLPEGATVHELKVWSGFYRHLLTGEKTFELRKDDRGYRAGHWLRLREWSKRDGYSGREMTREVTYLAAGIWMAPDHVAMALGPVLARTKGATHRDQPSDAQRYRAALRHIANGGLSPCLTFAQLILAGHTLLDAHRADCARADRGEYTLPDPPPFAPGAPKDGDQ